ncbi:hypothetical protein CYLTODRAFT_426062 [Cylindrobasidium torrendii FP15055 ss-10]|uniref:Uncharacterized protein n=1 Tax=Cylindrobasidium torrendii FP15055 ss-10 TaxID=1314674 RepID=A0A0D7AZU1_9AGAR|nr:hypothetical protein CYLTODRAFT_426062 [Cylindrobasidium torrendii FP15055 ss-10]
MASTAGMGPGPSAGPSSAGPNDDELSGQAAPLPIKPGEIGYSAHLSAAMQEVQLPRTPEPVLAARHPADGPPSSPAAPQTPTQPSDNSISAAPKNNRGAHAWLGKPVFGIRLVTLLLFLIQFLIVAGTCIAWAFAVRLISSKGPVDTETTDIGSQERSGTSSAIFIHVVFGVGAMVQLLFLERRVFRMRVERYAYVHPGEILPTSRRRALVQDAMSHAPWNRPPLPTYATVLQQSGVGTGDVEDHVIAQPPPPAYGNTRGSTLLLSGFLRNSLRRISSQSNDRPLSYRSTDDGWQIIQDADRARQLEDTLHRLEDNPSR